MQIKLLDCWQKFTDRSYPLTNYSYEIMDPSLYVIKNIKAIKRVLYLVHKHIKLGHLPWLVSFSVTSKAKSLMMK